MAAIVEVKYFNSFILKKTNKSSEPIWNGSFGVPIRGGYPVVTDDFNQSNWAIEEARIRGGYNNTSVDYGAKAYLVEEDDSASSRTSSIIWSGIYNSRTGINNSNVFSVADDITKSADPSNGSIQRLYAEDTNLVIFQEEKVSRALIDKDAVYSAEGGGSITNSNLVVGTIQAYAGEYGISKNPESFAVYGYQKYFSDKNNNAILRLSNNGITEISSYGMKDFFRDKLTEIDGSNSSGRVIAGYDVHNSQYTVSLQQDPLTQPNSTRYNTLSFDSNVDGWVSFFSYKPEQIFSLRNVFYTIKDGGMWKHYANNDQVNRGNFYSVDNSSSIKFVVNQNPSNSKSFQTVGYEGFSGWELTSFTSDPTGEIINPVIGGWTNFSDPETFDQTSGIKSYYEGEYVISEGTGVALTASTSTVVQLLRFTGSIGVGAEVFGIGVPPETKVVAFDIASNILTVNNNLNTVVNATLSFSLVVARNGYSTAFGTTNPELNKYYVGFELKENKYVANLINNSTGSEKEIIYGNQISGIKGFYAEATLSTDSTTDPGGEKQLFSVGTTYTFNNGY